MFRKFYRTILSYAIKPNTPSCQNKISDLPVDVLFHTFSFFNNKRDLAKAGAASKLFYQTAHDKQFQNAPWPPRDYAQAQQYQPLCSKKTITNNQSTHILTLSNDEIIYTSSNKEMCILNIKTGKPVKYLNMHTNTIRCFAKLPNQHKLVSADQHNFYVWDIKKGSCLKHLRSSKEKIACMTILSDQIIAYAIKLEEEKFEIRILDINTAEYRKIHTTDYNVKHIIALSEDKIAITRGCWVGILDIHKGSPHYLPAGHRNIITSLIKHSGNKLLSVADDFNLHLWDFETGTFIRQFKGHTAPIKCASPISDIEFISASYDGTCRVWNIATGACIACMPIIGKNSYFNLSNDFSIESLAVMPDGQIILGISNGQLYILPFAFKNEARPLEDEKLNTTNTIRPKAFR